MPAASFTHACPAAQTELEVVDRPQCDIIPIVASERVKWRSQGSYFSALETLCSAERPNVTDTISPVMDRDDIIDNLI